MKIKNKLFILVLLLFCFIFFNDYKSYASEPKAEDISDVQQHCKEFLLNNSDYTNYCISYSSRYNRYYLCFFYYDVNCLGFLDKNNNNNFFVEMSGTPICTRHFEIYYADTKVYPWTLSKYLDVTMDEYSYYMIYCGVNGDNYTYIYSTFKTCYSQDLVVGGYDNTKVNNDVFYDPTPTSNFVSLYELNLIDKNFNDTQHTFTLRTNKEDLYYNELMELINNENNYCIYLTDYTRLLTYENKLIDCPLKSRLVFDVAVT